MKTFILGLALFFPLALMMWLMFHWLKDAVLRENPISFGLRTIGHRSARQSPRSIPKDLDRPSPQAIQFMTEEADWWQQRWLEYELSSDNNFMSKDTEKLNSRIQAKALKTEGSGLI